MTSERIPGAAELFGEGKHNFSGLGSGKSPNNLRLWCVLKFGIESINEILEAEKREDISDRAIKRLETLLISLAKSSGFEYRITWVDPQSQDVPTFPSGFDFNKIPALPRTEEFADSWRLVPDIMVCLVVSKNDGYDSLVDEHLKEPLAKLAEITEVLLQYA